MLLTQLKQTLPPQVYVIKKNPVGKQTKASKTIKEKKKTNSDLIISISTKQTFYEFQRNSLRKKNTIMT